jgi:hypothetical protein
MDEVQRSCETEQDEPILVDPETENLEETTADPKIDALDIPSIVEIPFAENPDPSARLARTEVIPAKTAVLITDNCLTDLTIRSHAIDAVRAIFRSPFTERRALRKACERLEIGP